MKVTVDVECTPAEATATGSASAFFSIGLPVTVSDNTTSRFRASATDAAGNTSACSNELDYAEVSRSQSPKGAVAGTVVRVRSGIAFVKLSCPAGSGCAGNLKLIVQLARDGRKLVGRARNTVIGRSKFSIAAGRTKVVRVKLSHRGRLLVDQAGKQGLRAKTGGTGVRPRTVILKPARGRAKVQGASR